ncbi:MAG: S-layer homology domain-containing protein [Bacillota bacterium]
MSTIRRTTLGNLALVLFVAFLLQVVMATGGLVGDARAATSLTTTGATLSKTGDGRVNVTIRLSPITAADFNAGWTLRFSLPGRQGVEITMPGLTWDVAGQVYASVYTTGVYAKVYATVYANVYQMLLALHYLPSPDVYVGPGYYVRFTRAELDGTPPTVYLEGVFEPPEAPPVTPVPTTVPTDTGVLRIDPARDEAVLRVDAAKVETLLKDPQVAEVRLGIPATVDAGTLAVDIPPATVTGSEAYQKPLVAELGAAGQIELRPGTVTADDLKYTDERGVERQGNLRIAASRLSQDEAAPLLATADRSQFGNQQPLAQVYEVEVQVVADGKVVGTAPRAKKPLVLVLTFDKGKVDASGAPIETTMIYVWNETAQTWDPCASKVDPVTGKVTTERPRLSKYTVMAYRRTFADIAGHWAQRDIEIMAGRLVARGVTPTTFLPDGKVTRAQFAAFLQRALGIPEEKPAQPTFSDVAPDAWYYGAVEGAAKAGLVLGWEGKFRPDHLVTREEMATMVVRGIAYDGKKVTLGEQEVATLLAGFTDRGSISDWARDNAAIAVKAGIVLGRKVDSEPPVYAPKDDAMRAEAVTMIKRLLKYLGWF